MPSLETIRTVTIRGRADGVDQTRAALDRLTASIDAANQNLSQTRAIANDNREGWLVTGEGAASAANHLRQAAEAAYAFSPAFRGVVNEMAVPALKGAGMALEGVATGIVTATNVAGTGVIRLGTAIETTFPAFAVLAGNVKTAGAAMEAFSPTVGTVATSILSRLAPALALLGKGLLIYDAIKLVTEAWRLGNERLAEYVALSEKAAASGLTTEFYQRITKAAEDAKVPVEALTKAFEKLSAAAAPTLGGTAAQNRLDELVKAGNFGGNSGVGQLRGANSNEERLRALAKLYEEALDKGQRLAALDIAKAFGGDQLAANLAKDAGYLDKLLESADEMSRKELVSAGDIQRAVDLQDRLDAAEKILSQRWHPVQELLTQLGIKMKETWVSIVEAIAGAVDAVFKLGERIAAMLAPLMEFIQSAGQLIGKAAPYLAMLPGGAGLPLAAGAASIGVVSAPSTGVDQDTAQRTALMADARKRLAEAMSRHFDVSKAPVDEVKGAYDRAEESVRKYIETTRAAATTIGQTVGQQEKAKIEAQLVAAALKDGLSREAAEAKARMSGLGDAAGQAAQALEKARVAADIKFNRGTAFLNAEDVQIAQALSKLYGDDIPAALRSSEAAQMRFNNSLRQISDLGQDVNRSFLLEFSQSIRSGASAMQAFEQAGLSALNKIADKLVQMSADQLWQSAFGGGTSGGLGGLGGLLGLGGGGGVGNYGQVANATGLGAGTGGLSFPMFAGGTSSAPGGPAIVNEAGGEILDLPSGTRVIPHDVSMAMAQRGGGGGGSQAVHVSVGVSVDDEGKLQAYVKDVSQNTTAQGIQAFVGSPSFVGHVASASNSAKSRRLI